MDEKTINELNEYAGADGWAAMHRNEWKDDRLPFINFRK